MAKIVDIATTGNQLTCSAGANSTVSFSATNIADRPIAVQSKIMVEDQVKDAWFRIENPAEIKIARGATETVSVLVSVPPGAKAEDARFRLLIYSSNSPDVDFVNSEPVTVSVTAAPVAPCVEDEPTPPRRKLWWIPVAVVSLLLIIGGLTWFFWPSKVTVPDLVGMNLEAAQQSLAEHGLTADDSSEEKADVPAGQVFEQDPAPGAKVKSKTEVLLVIARAPEPAIADAPAEDEAPAESQPDPEPEPAVVIAVVDTSFSEARSVLEGAGFKVEKTETPRKSRRVNPGQVTAQDPAAGTQVDAGSTITLNVAAALQYGPDQCKPGYVWREAFDGDVVCVEGKVRDRAKNNNAQGANRREPGGGQYGPNTCKQGFVWRSAGIEDFVCVTGDVRSRARLDNASAHERWVLPPIVEPSVDRPGSDYRSFDMRQPVPEQCYTTCRLEKQCVAWTYVKPGEQGPAPRCWLKNAVPPATSSDCCTSGVM